MGMSASQSRLLSLTARMSDLELQAQVISNSKVRLSQESQQASRDYSEALDKERLRVFTGLQSDGTSSYMEATVNNLTNYQGPSSLDHQRFIKDSAGKLIVSSSVGNNYASANAASSATALAPYLTSVLGYSDQASATTAGLDFDAAAVTKYTNIFNAAHSGSTASASNAFLQAQLGYYDEASATAAGLTYASSAITYYTNLFNEIQESGGCNVQSNDNLNNSEWLTAQINAGNLFLYVWNAQGGTEGNGDFEAVSWQTGDNSLRMVSDDTDLAKAEAEYERTMADIQSKDKRFDLELKDIDTEHTAVQTELDLVKKVINKNIDRNLKMFDA